MSDAGTPRRLNLNQIYALDAVLNAATLTEAARVNALSQPAMSMALRKLRDRFGDELVVYGPGGRQLTALGEGLRPRVARLLREAGDTFNLRLAFDPATAARTVTIAAPEAVELMFLRRVVPVLLDHGPGLDVRLMSSGHVPTEALFRRNVDVAIVPAPMVDPRFPSLPLFDIGCAGLIWNRRDDIGDEMTVEQYLAARHVAYHDDPAGDGSHDWTRAAGESIFARRNVVVRTGLHSMLPQLVVGTDLVATISSWLGQYYESMTDVRVISLPVRTAASVVHAQWPAHRDNEPYIHWLVSQLVATIDWQDTKIAGGAFPKKR